jgi:hypothetical protein
VFFGNRVGQSSVPFGECASEGDLETPNSSEWRGSLNRDREPIAFACSYSGTACLSECFFMHEIIYLIGLIVVVMFILGALGLR